MSKIIIQGEAHTTESCIDLSIKWRQYYYGEKEQSGYSNGE
jgi:hypothetical protein